MLQGKENAKGMLCMVLHAHLPFVRHPEYPDFLEEDWFYEAITETYIPLLEMMNGLIRDGVDFRLTMSMTPPLVSMLSDDLLQSRYVHHISQLIELTEKEIERTQKSDPAFLENAYMYNRKFKRCLEVFNKECNRNLLSGFRRIQDLGKLEIITCGATHGFLPLMKNNPNAVRAQVAVACQNYEIAFGRPPRGIWNGECGYFPGLDKTLADNGIRFFFVDTHGILFADRRPQYGIFAPLYCPTGVAAFGRDVESSKAVWSADEGYPGDLNYREFYRDVGFDLDFDYIKPYIHESGLRINTGIKYYRITGKNVEKQPYRESVALERAADHAGNFLFNRIKQVEYLADKMDRKPLVVSPYDAELYGHWWYEGPEFLNFFLRKVHHDQDVLDMVTPSEYLQMYPENQVATPSFSSWGHQGYSEFWLNDTNDWIYRHLHKAEERMVELANKFRHNTDPIVERALNQCAREVLLAESSDWAFIMRTNTMVEYAVKRTKDHCARFNDLYFSLMNGNVDVGYLESIEWKDNIFPFINFRVYADQ